MTTMRRGYHAPRTNALGCRCDCETDCKPVSAQMSRLGIRVNQVIGFYLFIIYLRVYSSCFGKFRSLLFWNFCGARTAKSYLFWGTLSIAEVCRYAFETSCMCIRVAFVILFE